VSYATHGEAARAAVDAELRAAGRLVRTVGAEFEAPSMG